MIVRPHVDDAIGAVFPYFDLGEIDAIAQPHLFEQVDRPVPCHCGECFTADSRNDQHLSKWWAGQLIAPVTVRNLTAEFAEASKLRVVLRDEELVVKRLLEPCL